MKPIQVASASLLAFLPTYTLAFRYYITEYNSVNCNPVNNSCSPSLYVVWTDNDDSCDTIKNSKDTHGNKFEKGGSFTWDGTDQHAEFTLHFHDDDDWFKDDEGREVGEAEVKDGDKYALTVHKGRSCEDSYPFSTRFARRILTFSDE